MEDYASNSHKSKENTPSERKVEKVTTGKVETKKKSGIAKMANVFFAEDIRSVRHYIFQEVLIPALKRTFLDMINNGASMLVNGDTTPNRSSTPGSRVSYRSYYEKPLRSSQVRSSSNYGSVYDYDEIVFDNRGDAERVLQTLDEMMDMYRMVKVADLYDASGITPSSVMFKYGWTDIQNASVERTRDGSYTIRLPRALPLD